MREGNLQVLLPERSDPDQSLRANLELFRGLPYVDVNVTFGNGFSYSWAGTQVIYFNALPFSCFIRFHLRIPISRSLLLSQNVRSLCG